MTESYDFNKIRILNDGISNVVVANISGMTVTLSANSISGSTVSLSPNSISGQTVVLSTPVSVSGNVIQISGQNTKEFGSSIIPGTQTVGIGSGTALPSNACFSVTVRSLSGNTPMYVGGAGTLANSGVGMILYSTDSVTLKVNNTNQVSIFATNSGNQYTWIGVT